MVHAQARFSEDAGNAIGGVVRRLGISLLLGFVLFALGAPLLPFQDDWTYLTAPNLDFTWRDMLPGAAFWRPFDALWGGALGIAPGLFPWANRIAVVFGHVLCVWLALRLIEDLCGDGRGRFAALGFFAVSSGIAATIVNTDSMNLVWSCVWGCAGTLALLRGRTLWLAFGCYAVSILCKESGVSWLAVGPILAYSRERDWRVLARRVVVGAAILACYMGLRFALRGEVALGNGGDYALTLSPVTIARNLAILVGMGLSNVDGLALFAQKRVVFLATVILSLTAWCAYAACIDTKRRRDVVLRMLAGVCVVVAFAAPHCLFKNHHPAEMHFYPVVLGGAFALAMMPWDGMKRIPFSLAVVSMAGVFAIGWCDKMATIYTTSARAEKVLANIKAEVKDFDAPMAYAVQADKDVVRYSVFSQSPAWCLDSGHALRSLNGWRESKVKLVEE